MINSIIFSAPSASGKTTIVKHLIKKYPKIQFSISATTRPIRPGEVNGKDYHFVTPEVFKKMIQDEEFVEYEEVYKDQFYGTLKSEVEKIWDLGGIVVYDMDVVGGVRLKEIFGEEALSFFIKVQSIDELERRLRIRNTESEEKIKMRIDKAEHEMVYESKFDKVIINNELSNTLEEVEKIINDTIMTNRHGNSEKDPVYGYLEQPRELIFIDMDGVLVDMEKGMEVWSKKFGIPVKQLFDNDFYHSPGFYRDLPPIPGASASFNRIAKKYEVYILTAPSWENPSCYTDKRLWVEKYLGDSAYKRLIISNDKSLFTGKALIDDRTKYGVTKFKGEHIHFGTKKFPDWNSILDYLEC